MIIKSLILARGGSKGIPNKNITDINGKPLISYCINTIQKSLAPSVYVSSDSNNILEIAKKYGANCIKRPACISEDYSKSEEALIHFAESVYFDILVFIQPTSPLLIPEDINEGLKILNSGYDSVFSAYKEHWIPRWNTDITPSDWDITNRPMRQQIPEKYVENGAIYITTQKALLKSKLRYSGKIGILEMPFKRSFQIDTIEDLNFIRKIL